MNTNENISQQSFSNITKQFRFPTKHQAIVFNSVDGVKLEEYIVSLGSKIKPKNILFSSRMSNNRVCMYLASQELVDKFMRDIKTINIKNEEIHARRLISPSERIVLSNVCPSIPHEIIEKEITTLGLKPMSPMTFLRVAISNPEYSHIMSFRRQIYIEPLVNTTLPDSFLISFENTQYRIYVTSDNQTCYICKQKDHIAAECPKKSTETTSNRPNPKLPVNLNQPTNENLAESQTTILPISQNTSGKRNIEEILSPEPKMDQNSNDKNPIFPKPENSRLKKYKPSSSRPPKTNMKQTLETIKDYIDKNSPPNLNFNKLTDLLENASGSPEPLNIALEYTTNIPELLQILKNIGTQVTDRSTKIQITKITKKIDAQRNDNFYVSSEYESDSSASQA